MKALDCKKKPYETPQAKAYEVKPAGIICTSDSKPTSSNEEYEVVTTETTKGWFQ